MNCTLYPSMTSQRLEIFACNVFIEIFEISSAKNRTIGCSGPCPLGESIVTGGAHFGRNFTPGQGSAFLTCSLAKFLALMRRRWQERLCERYDPPTKSYYFGRCPELFRAILDYHLTGILFCPEGVAHPSTFLACGLISNWVKGGGVACAALCIK